MTAQSRRSLSLPTGSRCSKEEDENESHKYKLDGELSRRRSYCHRAGGRCGTCREVVYIDDMVMRAYKHGDVSVVY